MTHFQSFADETALRETADRREAVTYDRPPCPHRVCRYGHNARGETSCGNRGVLVPGDWDCALVDVHYAHVMKLRCDVVLTRPPLLSVVRTPAVSALRAREMLLQCPVPWVSISGSWTSVLCCRLCAFARGNLGQPLARLQQRLTRTLGSPTDIAAFNRRDDKPGKRAGT